MATLNRALSFSADLLWQDSKASAHYVTFSEASGIMDGWLYAGDSRGFSSINNTIALRNYRLWFWCYEQDGEYWFDIRAGHRKSHIYLKGRLECSRNGYAGLYASNFDASMVYAELPANQYPNSDSLWGLQGFDPTQLEYDQILGGITLVSPHGWEMKRLLEDGFHYLSEREGEVASLALKIHRT